MATIWAWAIPRGNKARASAHNTSHYNQHNTSLTYCPSPPIFVVARFLRHNHPINLTTTLLYYHPNLVSSLINEIASSI